MRPVVRYALAAVLMTYPLFAFQVFAEGPATGLKKTIAIGDVDAGYNMSGQKAYDVKETIQICLKKEIEKKGKDRYNVIISSPAVVTEGSHPTEDTEMPTLRAGKVPTQEEMAEYMAAMQRWQKIQSGEIRVHKPVAADAYFDFKISSSEGGADTGGAASTLGRLSGIDTSLGDVSTKTAKIHLICDMRDPATGALQDRYTAKASSVRFRELGGFTSYDYGDDTVTRERLFRRAVEKCAAWIAGKVD